MPSKRSWEVVESHVLTTCFCQGPQFLKLCYGVAEWGKQTEAATRTEISVWRSESVWREN